MKIKCVESTLTASAEQKIDDWIKDYMSVGAVYPVYGLRISKDLVYGYIFFEERHLVEVPIVLFEIVDGRLSNQWIYKYWENKDITFWPELFYRRGFFENFSEWEREEREMFEKLSVI